MVPLLHSVVILANSSTAALLKDSKKSYEMLPINFKTKKPGLVLVGCATAKYESRPIQVPIFQEKVIHSYTNQLNFGPNFEQNRPIFFQIFLKYESILAQI